jgi:hypothetical protein
VGLTSVKAILGTMVIPGMLDRFLAGTAGYEGQLTSDPRRDGEADNLFQPVSGRHFVHGRFDDSARTRVVAFNPALLRPALIVSAAVFIFALAALTF